MGKTLIAYYSRAGENIANGMTVMLSEGNTEVAAKYISEFVEADMFRIEQAVPYSDNYTDCTAQAKLDQSTNARPELKASLESIADYDTIYLGFPNYWGTMPMAVFTFLEQFDFTGKKIKPFVTHEGSGFGTAVEDITKICQGDEIAEGLAIHGADVKGYRFSIRRWCSK